MDTFSTAGLATLVMSIVAWCAWEGCRTHEWRKHQRPFVYRTVNGITVSSATQQGLDDALAKFGIEPRARSVSLPEPPETK